MTQTVLTRIDNTLNLLEDHLSEPHHKPLQTKAYDRPRFETKAEPLDGDFRHYLVTGERSFTQKGLTSQTAGGAAVPPEFMSRLHESTFKHTPMRRVSRVCEITGESLELITSHGEGGCGWSNELDLSVETEMPTLNRLTIPLNTLYAKPRISQRLLDESFMNVEDWVMDKIAADMSSIENKAFTQGDGAGKPKGFLNHAKKARGAGDTDRVECFETGTEGAIIDADVLINMITALKPLYLHGAVWMMPRSTLAAIRQLKESTTGQYIWQPGLTNAMGDTLLGYPIVLNDDMPTLEPSKASYSLAFGNFYQGYQIIERPEVHILRDPYSAKPYVEFYITKRVGGSVVCPDAIKFLHFGEGGL
jgi:HK97 family phage major capsid protein